MACLLHTKINILLKITKNPFYLNSTLKETLLSISFNFHSISIRYPFNFLSYPGRGFMYKHTTVGVCSDYIVMCVVTSDVCSD